MNSVKRYDNVLIMKSFNKYSFPLKEKKTKFILVFFVLAFYACVKEEALPVKVNFILAVVNNNLTAPVEVNINNQTSGAESYQWTFEGGTPSTSTAKNPTAIIFSKAGTYKITLKASNNDGSKDSKEMTLQIGNPITVNYKATIIDSNYPPAIIKISNTSTGGEQFEWTFEGGTPASSKEKEPQVIFEQAGKHAISLKLSNGVISKQKDTVIVIAPDIVPDFDIQTEFPEMEAPQNIFLKNKSISATQYQWAFQGADITNSAELEPKILFKKEGSFKISLTASNGKKSKTLEKTITIKANSNLISLKDIKLGINTAHAAIGCFYSTTLRKTFKQGDIISAQEGANIDIAYLGLDKNFSYNTFLSPDNVQNYTFNSIPSSINTQWLYVQKQLSVSDFDALTTDTQLKNLVINPNQNDDDFFKNGAVPSIFIFRTKDGRKGAVKIKSFVKNGSDDSYILIDIKVQKAG